MQAVTDIEIVPSGAALAAEVRGVDLSRPLDAETFATLEAAFNEHSVLYFRNQDVTPEQLIDYAKRYGEVQTLLLNHYAMKEHPEILYISNIQEQGKDIGYADAGSVWHTDMSYEDNPPRATMLHAREIPVTDDGTVLGDTLFASAVKAYDSLSPAMKERLKGLRAVHDVAGRRRKKGTANPEDQKRHEAYRLKPHPVTRTHPWTGRKAIYVNKGECCAIEGMPEDEALALIEELADTVVRDEFIYRHKWAVGDIIMWDNCAVQHLALKDYKLPLRRMMWRITVGYTDVYE
jgi:taurine dioxygenase